MSDAHEDDAFASHLQTIEGFDATVDLDVTATHARSTSELAVSDMPMLPSIEVAAADDAVSDLSLLGRLGEGGMSVVELARQNALNREVAVKSPKDAKSRKATALLHEAYVTGRLEHPHIVPIYMLGTDGAGKPHIVMKRIDGKSWQDILVAADRHAPDFLPRQLQTFLQVCTAVRFAHDRGIVHRDIKPENVMIGEFGEVYLMDWGLAVRLSADDPVLPAPKEVAGLSGTPALMAPEMTENDAANVDRRTDVFLLGATLHYLLTGTHRNQGEVMFEVLHSAWRAESYEYDDSVPDELASIANRACAKHKDERYQNVLDLADAVEAYLAHRDSVLLSDEADARREVLVGLLSASNAETRIGEEVHDVFGECRFAYTHALRMWPGNRAAHDGLQDVLVRMIEHHIDAENLPAARTAISQLPDARPDLVEMLDECAARLDDRRAELLRLQAQEGERDLSVGMTFRRRIMVGLAVFWGASTFHTGWVEWHEARPLSDALDGHMQSGVRNVLVVAALFAVFRRRLFVNKIATNVMATLLVMLVANAIMRINAWLLQTDILYARIVDNAMYALTAYCVGIVANDSRLSWLSTLFFASAISGAAWPRGQLFVEAAVTTAYFLGIAWLWRDGGRRE